jgi:hypothetical protein
MDATALNDLAVAAAIVGGIVLLLYLLGPWE